MGSTPHNWKCSKCKRTHTTTFDGDWYANYGKPELTGRVRRPTDWRPSCEYKCAVCGFVGWTRMPRAVHEAIERGFCPGWRERWLDRGNEASTSK